MEIKQIAIPRVENCTFDQIAAITELQKIEKIEIEDMVYFLSRYLDVESETLEHAVMSDLAELYEAVIKSIEEIETTSEPLPEIEIDGITYTQRLTNDKLPAIWFMTTQRLLAQQIQMHEISALCYIEKGQKFQDTDFHHRAQIFKDKMRYGQYHPLNGFFLQKFNEYRQPFLELQRIKKMKLSQPPTKL
jgi:hypothetical protein